MARLITYDQQDFLDRATQLFLQKGFLDTSMRDILRHTGLNRHSLYQLYPAKEILYAEVVRNYRERFLCDGLGLLKKEPKGLGNIRTFFNALLGGKGPVKCLMASSVTNCDVVAESAVKLARRHYAEVRKDFAENIAASVARKEIRSAWTPDELAELLVLHMHGLPNSTRLHGNEKVRVVVNKFLDSISK